MTIIFSSYRYIEYNLTVSNLHPDIDDIALFKLFGERYTSCRGAKVYQTVDGASKEYGTENILLLFFRR